MLYKRSLFLSVWKITMLLMFTWASAAAGSPLTQSDDEEGITPLMRAVRDGEHKELKELLKKGADLSARDPEGWTAMTYALLRDDEWAVERLVKSGVDVNEKDRLGNTLLISSVTHNNAAIVKLLIKRGADVNALGNSGYSALAMAQESGREDIIRLLDDAGAIAIKPEKKMYKLVRDPDGQNKKPSVASIVDKRPVPLSRPRLQYTEEARRNKISGIIRLRLLVGEDGRVKRTKIVRGLPDGLSQQARQSAYQIIFEPATKDGKPVEYWTPVDMEFNIK